MHSPLYRHSSKPEPTVSRGSAPLALMLATGLLGVFMGGAFQVARAGHHAVLDERARSNLSSRARNASRRIAALLSNARILESPATTTQAERSDCVLFFEPSTRLDDATGRPTHRLAFELEAGELRDGLDNDANGMVDDGRIVLTRYLGSDREKRFTVCRGVARLLHGEFGNGLDDNGNGEVDESGFHVDVDGGIATVTVSLALPGARDSDSSDPIARPSGESVTRTRAR